MTQPRRGQSRPSEVRRLREENRELREELARSSEQVLQLTQQLAAVEVIVRELAGGLDAVVNAWKTGDDVVPHLDALQQVIAGTRRKP
ncbi:MAG TPA: hypothetical protein PLU25_10555, partial [Acidobacteriota bacterium]|nr:hypothetical protein [Acidobacteriota bacterium]